MDRSPASPVPADEFYILKKGEILGPFKEAVVRAAASSGKFLPQDFVQRGGLPIWQPLSRWLDDEAPAGQGAIAPEWKSIATWAALRLHHDVLDGSILIGLACAAIGTLVVILAQWPAALWLPWFAIAVLVGILAMRKERVVPGLMVLLAVAAVPVTFSLLRRGTPAPPLDVIAEGPQVQAGNDAESGIAPPPSAPSNPPTVAVAKPAPAPPSPAPPPVAALSVTAAPKPAAPPTLVPELVPLPDAPPAAPPKPAGTEEDLVQRYSSALVLVSDTGGSGSGFICNAGGQTRLFTNVHVIAGMKQPRFTGLDGRQIIPGVAEAAAGHDIIRVALAAAPATALELLANFDSSVKIGDEIVVLGNSGGGGVVTKIEGRLVGVGPDRIEVSAEFIPGNSGSPIIHVPTGKVIGIATYLTRRYDDFAGNAQASHGPLVVRRFGFRLDSVPRWEPVNWGIFRAEAERIERISGLTEDIFDFLGALRRKQSPQFATETLRRPATEWLGGIRGRLSDADRLRSTQSFLGALRFMARADVTAAETEVRYSYFREELRKEREVRDKLYKAFDDEARQLSTPVRTAY